MSEGKVKRKIIFLIFAAVMVVAGGCGTDGGDTEASRDLFAMDTYMTVTAYGKGATEAVDQAADEISRLDQLLSTGNEDSEIYKINQSGDGILSEETAYLVERSLDLYGTKFASDNWMHKAQGIQLGLTDSLRCKLPAGTDGTGYWTITVYALGYNDYTVKFKVTDANIVKDEEETVDTTALEAAIKSAENLTESDYTAASWSDLCVELKEAKDELAAPHTQSTVDEATEHLNAAIKALVKAETKEEIEKYQSMDQFQVGIAVFDPDTTETQFYDNVRSVCEMMNNNISISVGVTWAEHGKEFNEKIMEADWRMYEQKNAYHQQQQAAQQELLQ